MEKWGKRKGLLWCEPNKLFIFSKSRLELLRVLQACLTLRFTINERARVLPSIRICIGSLAISSALFEFTGIPGAICIDKGPLAMNIPVLEFP